MKKILYSLASLLLLFSCNSKPEIQFSTANHTEFENKFELTSKGMKNLELDEETGFRHYSLRTDRIKDKEYISFINSMNNSVYIYESKSNNLITKIPLERDGDNGIGSLSIAAHALLSLDSLFIFNTSTGRSYILNNQGEIVNKWTMIDYRNAFSEPNPEPSTMSPIVRINDSFYFSCSFDRYLNDYSTSYSIAKFNIKTGKTEFMIALSEAYNKGYWGDQFKYNPSFDYDFDNKLVVSFPIDPELHTYSLDGEFIGKYFESSKYITSMTPFKEKASFGVKKDHGIRDTEQLEYSLTNSDFRRIIFDPYRQFYYRIAYIRPSVDQFRSGQRLTDFSISILDRSFRKVGERKFDSDKYSPSSILLSEDGLLLGRTDLYANDENLMSFEIISPNQK